MTYSSPYTKFVFEDYTFEPETGLAQFHYSFDGKLEFVERVYFVKSENYEAQILDRALQLAFILAGISYYKAFPTREFDLGNMQLSTSQASFFTEVYRQGLSQFVYENKLQPTDIAEFIATLENHSSAQPYSDKGIIAMQSGGKDSLLLAELLSAKGTEFTPWYVSQIANIPRILETFSSAIQHPRREVDTAKLSEALDEGALNGHVPVTYILLGYAVIDAILTNKNTVLAAIGHEGEEPHAMIGDYPVTHQWSKTWEAEQQLQKYVTENISPDMRVGSPLRSYSELKISKLFVEKAWSKYGHSFSSCNVANYKLGQDNSELGWCGNCPKCANSYLLFTPFVQPEELEQLFGGNLFEKESLQDNFKGLLGIDGAMKPFECVGEVDELRKAYQLAIDLGYTPLAFDVPASDFDIDTTYDAQDWALQMIQ